MDKYWVVYAIIVFAILFFLFGAFIGVEVKTKKDWLRVFQLFLVDLFFTIFMIFSFYINGHLF